MEGRIVPPPRQSGQPYRGINVLMLWGAAMESGYLSPVWMTYKQAKAVGAPVRKGKRGHQIVYADTLTRSEEAPDGTEQELRIPFLKAYTVFNAAQIEGLPAQFRSARR